MSCYAPLRGYRAREGRIVFNRNASVTGAVVAVACGQCIGCRVDRSREWALRCLHESKLYDENCFVTLTYSEDKLPLNRSLDKSAFPAFMKRLRARVSPRLVRFYACGEYGGVTERPHYHACLFNYNFPDRKPWKKGSSGEMQYKSALLDELWGAGLCSVGTLTYESAAYCARYILQKMTGEEALKYEATRVDVETGEILGPRVPPFNLMSRRPGIGYKWLEQFLGDAYPSDFCVLDGKPVPNPKYYDKLFAAWKGEDCLQDIKDARKVAGKVHVVDRTKERLKVREAVHIASLNRLKRELE